MMRSGPLAARLRSIRAGSASGTSRQAPHNPPVVGSSPTAHQPRTAARKLRLSGVHVEDFDVTSCYTAAFDPRVGGDQGDVESFGQGDILSVVGGQVGMKALQARPQRQHVLPLDGERAVVDERGVGFSFRDFLSAYEPVLSLASGKRHGKAWTGSWTVTRGAPSACLVLATGRSRREGHRDRTGIGFGHRRPG